MSLTILNTCIVFLHFLKGLSVLFLNWLNVFFLFCIISSKRHLKIVSFISSFTAILSSLARKYKVYGYNMLQTYIIWKYFALSWGCVYPKRFSVIFKSLGSLLKLKSFNKLPKDWPDWIKLYSKDYERAFQSWKSRGTLVKIIRNKKCATLVK